MNIYPRSFTGEKHISLGILIAPMTMKRMARSISSLLSIAGLVVASTVNAAETTVYSNDFESQSIAAASLADTDDADPVGVEWSIADDAARSPTTAGAGVQVISWMTNSAGAPNKALLLRTHTEAQIHLRGIQSGSRYQLDFRTFAVRQPTSSHNFYVLLRGAGSDINVDDYLAYRVDRATNSLKLFYYDGVGQGAAPVAGAWVDTGATQVPEKWQHHRFVIDPNALTFNLYIDNMTTPVVTGGDLSRCEVGVPTIIRLINEANSADDGYYIIDDISLTVEGAKDLNTTLTEGFESYPARTTPEDDADPMGPWITTEVDGTGTGRLRAPGKVQVVGADVIPARSGSKSLKIEAGQRAGSTLAWGVPPQSDVQVTWWARVPAAPAGATALYLRMSLYGAEDNNTLSGDSALLGFGSRSATVGRTTSLLYYAPGPGWIDTGVDFTPDVWEEYRLITHTSENKYSIIKNPSSAASQVVIDHAPLGMDTDPAASSFGPMFMAAWSSSNGTNHPPVYVDDIEVKSLVSVVGPMPMPYTVQTPGGHFTNVTSLVIGETVGSVAVDPRDKSTILFTIDATPAAGAIYKATKVASGNWQVNPQPLVTNLDRPSGMTIDASGTIWWVHDFGQALMRLKSPWESNTVERIVSDFGTLSTTNTVQDDDPFDIVIAPSTFTGSRGSAGQVVIGDRGLDGDAYNALVLVNPATTQLNQTNYSTYLVDPTATTLGGNLIAMTTLPASGEVVTITADGQLSAVNGDGTVRFFWPGLYLDPASPMQPSALATDPLSGRIWIADDLRDEVWSIQADGAGTDRKELAFPLVNLTRPERQIDFHEPGLAFAPDGKFLVVSDTSTLNGGGRLHIFHNEVQAIATFKIGTVTRTAEGIKIEWQSSGASAYNVLRGTDIANPASFVNVSGDITGTSYTDTAPISGAVFYRVVAKP